MKRRISAVEARKRLGELLESVYYRGDEITIERAGKPMAVVIPSPRYEAMKREKQRAKERLIAMIEEVHERNKDLDEKEIERLVEQEIQAVRAERRARDAGRKAG